MPLTTTPSNVLTYEVVGTIDLAGAEISAYDAATRRLFTTSNSGLQVIDISDPSNPKLVETINLTAPPFNLDSNDISSVAVKDGLVAITVISSVRTDPGTVVLLDANGNLLNALEVGAQPDMITFSPDGLKLLVANEGEASLDTVPVADRVNPNGSISVIDISGGPAAATVQTAGFGDFNDDAAALIAEGVRLFVNSPGFAGTTVAQDLEPEYIAVAPDGLSAVITLQEANALALLDLSGDTPVITDIVPLGVKDWLGLDIDTSDRDGAGNTTLINFQDDQPIFGMYMPDGVASFAGADGKTYYILANEGDDRNDFLSPNEAITYSALISSGATFDPVAYPNPGALNTNAELARLNVPGLAGVRGDTDGDGDIDQILTYGGRSFSIVDEHGNLVFESGDQIDTFVADYFPGKFDDTRSDNKGSEPEGATIAVIDGRTYAFVVLERFNGTMVYDVTDPADPSFTTFLFNEGDAAPEQGLFISGDTSPIEDPLFVVSNEGSGSAPPSVTIYRIVEPQTEGANGKDDLVGTILDDEMTGGNAKDLLSGIAGDDELFGENGSDTLSGGPGDDLLYGGNGSDTLATGSGEDIVFVGRGNGVDIVTDFNTDLDSVGLLDDVTLLRSQELDFDGDGTTDLLLQFSHGGGALVLLGVSDASAVQFVTD